MPLVIPPGYLHAVYVFDLTGDNEAMVTTCGHEIDSSSGASGADSADDLFNSFGANILPGLTDQLYLDHVTTYVGQDGAPPLIYESSQARVQGGATSVGLPQNNAYLVRKRTDLSGRRGRGRFYVPGVVEGGVDHLGNLSGPLQTDRQTEWTAWYDDLTALVAGRLYPPVVLHRSEGIGEEPLPTPITQFIVDGRIATQRRRLRP